MIEGCILWVFSGVNKIVCHCLPPLMTNLRPPLWTMARHTYPDYSNFGFITAAVVMLGWKHSVNVVVSSFLLWQKSWPKYFTWTEWGLSWRQSSNICVCSVKTGKWSKLKSYCILFCSWNFSFQLVGQLDETPVTLVLIMEKYVWFSHQNNKRFFLRRARSWEDFSDLQMSVLWQMEHLFFSSHINNIVYNFFFLLSVSVKYLNVNFCSF